MLEGKDDFSIWEFRSMNLLHRGLGINHLPMASEDLSTFEREGWRDEVTFEQREVWEYVAPRYLASRIRKHPIQQALETDAGMAEQDVQAEMQALRDVQAEENRILLQYMGTDPSNIEDSLGRLSDSFADMSDAEFEEWISSRPAGALGGMRDNSINHTPTDTEPQTIPASRRIAQLQGPINFERNIRQRNFRHRTFNPMIAHPFMGATNANGQAQQPHGSPASRGNFTATAAIHMNQRG